MTTVYKIMDSSTWRGRAPGGDFPLADVDRRDGYVHLSTEDQVLETARLHFAGRDDLVAVAFDADDLGAALKWEPSRGGGSFPHLYAGLPVAMTRGVRQLVRRDGGTVVFGEVVS